MALFLIYVSLLFNFSLGSVLFVFLIIIHVIAIWSLKVGIKKNRDTEFHQFLVNDYKGSINRIEESFNKNNISFDKIDHTHKTGLEKESVDMEYKLPGNIVMTVVCAPKKTNFFIRELNLGIRLIPGDVFMENNFKEYKILLNETLEMD
jgi:hypothetical protein